MIWFRVLEVAEASFANVKRHTTQIVVERGASEQDIREILEVLIPAQSKMIKVNALAYMVWYDGTDLEGVCTAAIADWAPYGDWHKSISVQAGDYSKHRTEVLMMGKP